MLDILSAVVAVASHAATSGWTTFFCAAMIITGIFAGVPRGTPLPPLEGSAIALSFKFIILPLITKFLRQSHDNGRMRVFAKIAEDPEYNLAIR